jgi:hypothetical protein
MNETFYVAYDADSSEWFESSKWSIYCSTDAHDKVTHGTFASRHQAQKRADELNKERSTELVPA